VIAQKSSAANGATTDFIRPTMKSGDVNANKCRNESFVLIDQAAERVLVKFGRVLNWAGIDLQGWMGRAPSTPSHQSLEPKRNGGRMPGP
jgi:hypothetical protein